MYKVKDVISGIWSSHDWLVIYVILSLWPSLLGCYWVHGTGLVLACPLLLIGWVWKVLLFPGWSWWHSRSELLWTAQAYCYPFGGCPLSSHAGFPTLWCSKTFPGSLSQGKGGEFSHRNVFTTGWQCWTTETEWRRPKMKNITLTFPKMFHLEILNHLFNRNSLF